MGLFLYTMIYPINFFFGVIVLLALFSFFSQFFRFLIVLLSFEVAVLSLALMTSVFGFFPLEVFGGFVILTFGACEAAVGLALLVLMRRRCGSDIISQLNVNKC